MSYITVNGYLGVVLLFNTAILVVSMMKMWRLKLRGVQTGNKMRRLWKDCATVLGLSVVLGLPWGLAFSTYGPLSLAGIYLFTTLNAFQGKCNIWFDSSDLFLLLFPPVTVHLLLVFVFKVFVFLFLRDAFFIFQVFLCSCGSYQSHASHTRRRFQRIISLWPI